MYLQSRHSKQMKCTDRSEQQRASAEKPFLRLQLPNKEIYRKETKRKMTCSRFFPFIFFFSCCGKMTGHAMQQMIVRVSDYSNNHKEVFFFF